MDGEIKHVCLQDDVERVIVETEEQDPKTILIIDRSDEPLKISDGYRVRMKFTED